MKMNPALKRILTAPLAILGVLLMLLEERIWNALVELGHWLGSLPVFRTIEARIRTLSPKMAACALFFPVLLILPVKFLAVWIMSTGRIWSGLGVLVSAKLAGTALVARVYTLCEPALSCLPWFVRLRARFLNAKDWAHRRLDSWPMWRLVRRVVHRLKVGIRNLWRAVPEPE